MKKLWFRRLLPIFLLLLLVIPIVNATVTVKQGTVFKTSSNNAQFTMGADFEFYKVEVNSTHLWMDKQYTAKHYTRYCIYVTSPNDVQLTVNTWFATANSTAKLTITSPLSIDISMEFTSPNLISASVKYKVGGPPSVWNWNATTKTLTFTVNSDVDDEFIISATVTETEYNHAPENVEVVITDMEGTGPWVFSETSYYTFRAKYWDGDGYDDLSVVKIRFSDGTTTVVAVYDVQDSEWSLESGDGIVNLKDGSLTVLDEKTIQVTFLIYFENTILDALDVDIYSYCEDLSGAKDDWQLMQNDYFNIYNLGGHSTLTSSGNAGRLTGGDVFDLYAYNNSWAEASITFRNLQHIKIRPMLTIRVEDGGWDLAVFGQAAQLEYSISYCVDDTWVDGWKIILKSEHAAYIDPVSLNDVRWMNFTVEWYEHNNFVKAENNYYFFRRVRTNGYDNVTSMFWIDLWFNRENASTTYGARINAYEYPMIDTSNPWFRWLSGQTWGIDENKKKQSMSFGNLEDADGNIISVSQISMIKIGAKISFLTTYSGFISAQVSDYDVFDLTFGTDPLQGIQTPVFDESIIPVMPRGGLLGAITSWLSAVIKKLGEVFGPAVLSFWNAFVGFLDTIFTWLGWPNGFSQILSWIASFATFLVNAFTVAIQWLTTLFTILSNSVTPIGQVFLVVAGWITSIFQGITGMITWLNVAIVDSGLWDLFSSVLLLIGVMLPFYEIARMEEKGFGILFDDLSKVIDIASFVINITIRAIQAFLAIIGRIIESIPIIE